MQTADGARKKRKKVNVPAGKSVTAEDVQATLNCVQENQKGKKKLVKKGNSEAKESTPLRLENKPMSDTDSDYFTQTAGPSNVFGKKKPPVVWKRKKSKSSSSEDVDDVDMVLESEGESSFGSWGQEGSRRDVTLTVDVHPQPIAQKTQDYNADDFVLVLYNGQKYPGIIKSISSKGPVVECMEKKVKFWRWPEKLDCLRYDWKDICGKIKPPKLMNKRNHFFVPELDIYV